MSLYIFRGYTNTVYGSKQIKGESATFIRYTTAVTLSHYISDDFTLTIILRGMLYSHVTASQTASLVNW